MKITDTMSADAIVAEAHRRSDRRARNLPLDETPAEAAERIQEDDARLEKEIQREIIKLYIAYRCRVYNLSQPRATKQSVGLADLWVIHPGSRAAWWMEVKTPTGEQSEDQVKFGEACARAGIGYIVGGLATAKVQLVAIGAAVWVGDEIEPRRASHVTGLE